MSSSKRSRSKILLLHGNRQTGDVLSGRLDKLKKALRCLELEIVAPDAPHLYSDNDHLDSCNEVDDISDNNSSSQWQRTWWHRDDKKYHGLEESIAMLDRLWNDSNHEFVSIIGFSQGSRLAHLISIVHTLTNGVAFPGLKCVIHCSGYGDCSLPDNFYTSVKDNYCGQHNNLPQLIDDIVINIPSLHVMGESDALIPLKSSETLLEWYNQPVVHIHPGSHFIPVKKTDIDVYLAFFTEVRERLNLTNSTIKTTRQPDEEHVQMQVDEVNAIAQIFPAEFRLISRSSNNPDRCDPDNYFDDNQIYDHPIKYSIILQPQDDALEQSTANEQLWPPKHVSLVIEYSTNYPDSSPMVSLSHEMNYMEFSMQASDALLCTVQKAMEEESGMPCVMNMVYAARSFFQDDGLASFRKRAVCNELRIAENADEETVHDNESILRPSTAERVKLCKAQGLQVAYSMLDRAKSDVHRLFDSLESSTSVAGKGGTWHYTVGLVGKPSAGKSTFFNAATFFARQRGEAGGAIHDDNAIMFGGAAMGATPFTTIDPNVGYCLIPAPPEACPEDELHCLPHLNNCGLTLGSTHGRDSKGRRLLPVCLKDVAGLVPGAYQGRGRGNKFLDDLTDADVLIHIVDASGSSDPDGNKTDDLCHPRTDLEWVRNELVHWVYSNVSAKWDSIRRRGMKKLGEMFSGYRQSESFTYGVFKAVGSFVKENENRDEIFEKLGSWDEGDLYRLVSAFLGIRFPMTLALNKNDIPSSVQYIHDIISELPMHGAHSGVGVCAHREMKFIQRQLSLALKSSSFNTQSFHPQTKNTSFDGKVLDCLQAAISLREPVYVFPVNDMVTYAPLPGMTNYATRDPSLPHKGVISCICNVGGCAPSLWNNERNVYTTEGNDDNNALRDVIMLKPGSTVNDVFLALKNMGALRGEFVRAEGASVFGEKSKPITKSSLVNRTNRILRIMTTKRVEWQKK